MTKSAMVLLEKLSPTSTGSRSRKAASTMPPNAWASRARADADRGPGTARADIQATVLLGHVEPRDRHLRAVGRHPLWMDQRRAFRDLFPNALEGNEDDC